ncbi:primosomal protein N' domain protein [Streptococcus constellatus subsp. pharyngis SK1060 = CCUG 46377]|uniref:Primosomal protein N' domain protein n=1 Tax=Streptococcus constellatus subsp. pharyngis SK1060 = CCUG 46377 TaxID=1035184 RepID=F9P4G0_STRCV|nr:primosomal protein N' domain protein [Streptococcus constellatus subsp. pharyngis SK1060 = CCUG 46377]
MLPRFLNSSYDKILHAQPSLNEEDRLLIFGNVDQQHFSSLDKELQAKVMRLTRQGAIQLEYQATDQKHIKTEKWYRVDHEVLGQLVIPNRAKKSKSYGKFYRIRLEYTF